MTSSLAGTVFYEFASLYRELGKIGLSPDQVDGLEVWEAGALLGADEPEQTSSSSPGRDLIAQRYKAMKEGRPMPEPEPTDPTFMQQVMNLPK